MPNGIEISKDTFQGYSVESKLDTLFDIAKATHDQACLKRQECNTRFEKLEGRKLIDKGVAVVSGVIGGLLGALGIDVPWGS